MKTHSLSFALALSALAISAGCATETTTKTASAAPAFDRAALEQLPRIDRMVFGDDGLPYFIRGDLGVASGALSTVADAELNLASTVDRVAAPYRLSSADFSATKVSTDVVGMTHVRYQQMLNGLPVVGNEMIVHVNHDGAVDSVTSVARPLDNPPTAPIVTIERAQDLAMAATMDGKSVAHSADLVYIDNDLAWKVVVSGTEALVLDYVFVSATGGAILARHPQVFTALDRVVRDAEGENQFVLIDPDGGGISTDNVKQIGSEGSPPADPVGTAAYENTGGMFKCYNELFGRDSYDNAGATLESIVHITFFDVRTFTNTPNNAAWLLSYMLYGDGDGEIFSELARGFDVTAHELTHGVITAGPNLIYNNESGALNEGMADIMAAVCEAWNDGGIVNEDTWLIGEDVFTPNVDGDALRYMNDPTADGPFSDPELASSRDYYADRYQGTKDNGGVHINSGIANLAFALLVEGGTHPQGKSDVPVASMDIYKAGEIFLSALDNYMTATTNFEQGRTATEEAAMALYGATEATKVGLAWAAVGVGDAPRSDTSPPSIAIASPADGATVAPGFEIAVTASDDIGVTRVELYIDGSLVGELASAPYTFTAPDTLADGSHTVQAVASDGFNEVDTEITVTLAGDGDGDGGDGDGGDGDGGDGDGGDGDGGDGDGDGDGGGGGGGGGGDDDGGCSVSAGDAPTGAFLLLLGLAFLARRRRR